MKIRIPMIATLLAVGLAAAVSARADVAPLQMAWAQAMYDAPEAERADALEVLSDRARAVASDSPEDPEALIWQGIVLSTYAGEKGGLGALSLVKEARKSLEAALEIDEFALGGSAHTSLGSLYAKVPGWPIAFGSEKKARQHLQRALEINPTSIDAHFFLGELLMATGEETAARHHLEQSLHAPNRLGRARADAGRREEARVLLAQIGG